MGQVLGMELMSPELESFTFQKVKENKYFIRIFKNRDEHIPIRIFENYLKSAALS